MHGLKKKKEKNRGGGRRASLVAQWLRRVSGGNGGLSVYGCFKAPVLPCTTNCRAGAYTSLLFKEAPKAPLMPEFSCQHR